MRSLILTEEITSEDPYSQEAASANTEAHYPDLARRRRERRRSSKARRS